MGNIFDDAWLGMYVILGVVLTTAFLVGTTLGFLVFWCLQ